MNQILFCSDFPFRYHNPEAEERLVRFVQRGYNVRYVEHFGVRNPRPRHALRLLASLTRTPNETAAVPFEVVSPKLLPLRGAPLAASINSRWLGNQLAGNEDLSDSIFWIRYPSPELVSVVDRTRPRLVIYELADDHTRAPGLSARTRRLVCDAERAILQRAELALASSRSTYERLAETHANVALIPAAAVDLVSLKPMTMTPEDKLGVYVGGIDYRFDLDLMLEVADRLPDWHLLVAGPASRKVRRRLASKPNITLPGRVASSEVPRLLGRAAVCLMPYRRTPFTDTLFPVKLIQYLAAGRPIVSTDLQPIMDFRDVVTVARDSTQFVAGMEAAADMDSHHDRERRVMRARPFDWERRIDGMETAIQRALRGTASARR